MKIIIKNKSELPIYEQIEEQIKSQIIDGSIKGYFVAPRNNELMRERMLCEMEEAIEKAVTSGRNAGLSDDEIVNTLCRYLEG